MQLPRQMLSWLYLLLAIAGLILPTMANISFAREYGPGFDVIQFIRLANVNSAAQSLSRDLFVGATAVFIWIITEAKRLGMKNILVVIISNFLIAFAFAAPLFLYLRERRLIEMENENEID